MWLLVVLFLPVNIVSCGGGGGVNEASFSPATRADLIISLRQQNGGFANNDLLTAVDIILHLPNGVDPNLVTVDGLNNLQVQQVTPGVDFVHLIVVNAQGITFGSIGQLGNVVRVRCPLSTPLTAAAFISVNNGNPLTDFQPTGIYSDLITNILLADLLLKLSPEMSVSLN